MKKRITVVVEIDICADTNEGFIEASEEALRRLECNFVLSGNREVVSGEIHSKTIDPGEGWVLASEIMQLRKMDVETFFKSRSPAASVARHMFAYCARRLLSWEWNSICEFLDRERTGLIVGVESIKYLTSKRKSCRVKVSKNILKDRDQIVSDLEEIFSIARRG